MTIKITQTCDGCGQSRGLEIPFNDYTQTIEKVAITKGWREVLDKKHICIDCIKLLLNK